MPRPSSPPSPDAPPPSLNWRILISVVPYLLEFRARVAGAFVLLLAAKVAGVLVPVALKYVVDHFERAGLESGSGEALAVAISVPLALLIGYGLLRFAATFFGELRDAVFARVAERGMRRIALRVFRHLHRLELGFHLSRETGGLARDIERGTSGISFLLRFLVFNILPTLFEIVLVAGILWFAFGPGFMLVVLVAVAVYIAFSIVVTEWRTRFVREANLADNSANTRAIDSLLNYETVKYFGNENYEAERYDAGLAVWETARLKNVLSLVLLNSGQALIIALALTAMMILAARGVASGEMTLGDLVMVNAYMIQLFLPLNFLGFVYREIRQSLANIERLFGLLERDPQVVDRADAPRLEVKRGRIEFDHVAFGYEAGRPILHDVSFTIEPGTRLAVVGTSGAGKSTLARLLFRFYDPSGGAIRIDAQDLRAVTQTSLHAAIGVVPQDTVLFNDSIRYNVAYGRPDADDAALLDAVRRAHLEPFIAELPNGLDTLVGERGLKVSGGEKQRIAIARMLLKNPAILILDEATSSLDSHAEAAILDALDELASGRTTLVIAHRLSTIRDAERIVVLDAGRVAESGTHDELLAREGVYARLWAAQHRVVERARIGGAPRPAPAMR